MREALRLALAALACDRLTRLLVVDDGPGEIFLRLRTWAGRYDYGPEADVDGEPRPASSLGRLAACPYCVGMWVALGLAVLLRPASRTDFVLTWLGLAGAQAVLEGQRDA